MRETVLSTLRESFTRASVQALNTPLSNAMNSWVGCLPDEYMVLLQASEPWAIVALAHFCVLVHRSETVWFMKGNANQLLQQIIDNLKEPWGVFIEWLRKECGVWYSVERLIF